jgi:hypothetical protein
MDTGGPSFVTGCVERVLGSVKYDEIHLKDCVSMSGLLPQAWGVASGLTTTIIYIGSPGYHMPTRVSFPSTSVIAKLSTLGLLKKDVATLTRVSFVFNPGGPPHCDTSPSNAM